MSAPGSGKSRPPPRSAGSRVAADNKTRPAQPVGSKTAAASAAKAASKPAAKGSAKGADKSLGWLDRLKRVVLLFRRKLAHRHALQDDPIEHLAAIKRQAVAIDSSEAAELGTALKAVLDGHASSRSVLVHLAALEKALSRHGMKALDKLPPEVTRRALSQLETLVSDWSQSGLAALRARITAALIKHKRSDTRRSTTKRLSDFEDSNRLQVNDASVSTFMAASARWERSVTGSLKPDSTLK